MAENNLQNLQADVDGEELITNALMGLVNSYPGLEKGDKFTFAQLDDDEGLAIFPSTGAFIYEERQSITGHITQMCQYPFTAVYRASGLNQKRKINAKEWLDKFGRWIEKKPVVINGVEYKLTEWPELSESRQIRDVARQSPAYLIDVPDNKSENWICEITIRYRTEYDREGV